MLNDRVKTNIICSQLYDPCFNLALEEYLLNNVSKNQIILYLWQNDSTVVLGKNQSAWKECDWNLLKKDGGKLSRRLSGGGAVYHDLGNLNFTFIMDKELYDLNAQFSVILNALKNFGIEGKYVGRNDLIIMGKKFSGNAFYFKDNAAYHHGTLLVDTDFSKLVRYLKVSDDKIKSKGIDSVKSRVINLSEICKGLTIEDLIESIKRSFGKIYGGTMIELPFNHYSNKVSVLYQKYASWQWRFGNSPDFDIEMKNRFSWGDIDLGFKIENGKILSANFYSDALDNISMQKIVQHLNGLTFQKKTITEKLKQINSQAEGSEIINDLIHWLNIKI